MSALSTNYRRTLGSVGFRRWTRSFHIFFWKGKKLKRWLIHLVDQSSRHLTESDECLTCLHPLVLGLSCSLVSCCFVGFQSHSSVCLPYDQALAVELYCRMNTCLCLFLWDCGLLSISYRLLPLLWSFLKCRPQTKLHELHQASCGLTISVLPQWQTQPNQTLIVTNTTNQGPL
jgi:hypothetical protein